MRHLIVSIPDLCIHPYFGLAGFAIQFRYMFLVFCYSLACLSERVSWLLSFLCSCFCECFFVYLLTGVSSSWCYGLVCVAFCDRTYSLCFKTKIFIVNTVSYKHTSTNLAFHDAKAVNDLKVAFFFGIQCIPNYTKTCSFHHGNVNKTTKLKYT